MAPFFLLLIILAIPAVNPDGVLATLEARSELAVSSIVYWPSYPGNSNPALPLRSTPTDGASTVKLPWGIYTTAITEQVIDEATATVTSSVGAGSAPTASVMSTHQSLASSVCDTHAMLWFMAIGVGLIVVKIVLIV